MAIRSKLLWIMVCLALIGVMPYSAVGALDGGAEPITAANAHRLKLLTTWGLGTINDLAWSPDHKTLAAGTQAGLRLFNAALPYTAPRLLVTDAVNSLAFSLDGKLLAAGTDQGIQLWTTANWQSAGQRFGGAYGSIAFSPDGKLLAASSRDSVYLWDVTGRQLVARPYHDGFCPVAFSPDGTRLACGMPPIRLWDIQKQAQVMELEDKTGALRSAATLAFSPDGTRLASVDNERIGLWDTRTGRQVDLLSLKTYSNAPRIEFDRKGTLLLTAVTNDFINDTIILRNVLSDAVLVTFRVGPNGNFGDLSFSPDGTILSSLRNIYRTSITAWWDVKTTSPVYQQVTDNADIYWLPKSNTAFFLVPGGFTTPRLWKVRKGQEQPIIAATYGELSAFDPVHDRLALSYVEGPTHVLDARTGDKLFSVPSPGQSSPDMLIFTPDGKYLVVGVDNTENTSQGMIIDAATGKQQAVATIHAPFYDISSVAFDPGGKLIALNESRDGVVLLVDIQTGEILRTLASQGGAVTTLRFNTDGSRIAYGGYGLIRLWDTQTGKQLAELTRHVEYMYLPGEVDFSLDGKRAAFVDEDTVRLYDADTGRQLGELVASGQRQWPQARFSPDGTRLVVTYANAIQVWDAQSGTRLLEWRVPDELTHWLFSPDGSILITATASGVLQLWDPATGQQIIELKGHHAGLRSAVFSPDRSLLATSSEDSTVRLWGLDKP